MELSNLITFFRQGGNFSDFCQAQGLDEAAEAIEIFAREPVGWESELGFFAIEDTGGQIELQVDGVKYHNLFDFFYFLDVIKEVDGHEEWTDAALAQRLFSYAMNDA